MVDLAVVIPVRDEEAAIRPLFESLAAALKRSSRASRVIVVDGVSTDGTVEEVRRWGEAMDLEVVRLESNLGLGGALDAGLQIAVRQARVVVTMDGDNSHNPDTIGSMLSELDRGCDVVIASRFQPGGEEIGVAGYRKVLSHGASATLRTLFPYGPVRDYSSGFRAYRSAALERVRGSDGRFVAEEGFACMMELLLKLRASGAIASEVPLVLRYDLKETESKMSIGPTIVRYVSVISRNLNPFREST